MTEERTTIDVTPTWAGLLPVLLAIIQDGTSEGQRNAREELRRMAQAADRWNKAAKHLRPLLDEHAQASDEALRQIAADINREFGFDKPAAKPLPTATAATVDGASTTAWRKDSGPSTAQTGPGRPGTLNGSPYTFAMVGEHVWFELGGAWWTLPAGTITDDWRPAIVMDLKDE